MDFAKLVFDILTAGHRQEKQETRKIPHGWEFRPGNDSERPIMRNLQNGLVFDLYDLKELIGWIDNLFDSFSNLKLSFFKLPDGFDDIYEKAVEVRNDLLSLLDELRSKS